MPDREHGDEIDRLVSMVDVASAAGAWMVAENARLVAENEKLVAEKARLKARLEAMLLAKGIENPN